MSNPLAIDLLDNEDFLADLRGIDSERIVAQKWGIARSTVGKWRTRTREADAELEREIDDEIAEGIDVSAAKTSTTATGGDITDVRSTKEIEDWDDVLRAVGMSPDNWEVDPQSIHVRSWMQSKRLEDGDRDTIRLYSYSVRVQPKGFAGPEWQPVDRGPAFLVEPPSKSWSPIVDRWKTAVLAADSQIGYRLHGDKLEPYHDEAAIDVMLQIVDIERPDQFVFMGDILDLSEQGRWAQEAAFARTTQPAIDYLTRLGAELRARVPGQIVYIEGNHDRRMQNFVEANALSAFGLRKGALPESWPVMSLPNLLRLDEFDIKYMDGYPAAHWWVNDQLRCEHGTKVRSSGSTAEKYVNETPHISRAFGHTHRLEAQSKTTWDRAGKIKSVAINPGCLCRVDGAVPSVNGAIGQNGRPLTEYENWQQGVAVIRYKESGEFFWDLVQIEDGRTVYESGELAAAA